MKNSSDTIGNRIRYPTAWSAERQSTAPSRTPSLYWKTEGFFVVVRIKMPRMRRCLVTSPLLHVQNKIMTSLSMPVQKCRGGSKDIAPLILNHSTIWRPVVGITPRPLYPRVRTPGSGAPEPLWTFWRRGNPLVPAGIPLRTVQLLPVPLKTFSSVQFLPRQIGHLDC